MQNININLEISCTIIFANLESILFPSISRHPTLIDTNITILALQKKKKLMDSVNVQL
jgi:hypothetical protein